MTGLFVSNLIGERVIISGLKKEKKATDRTEMEISKEDDKIRAIQEQISQVSKDIQEIKNKLDKTNNI
jgi:predicted  nucleic acid-binding Zn-ribbon protein